MVGLTRKPEGFTPEGVWCEQGFLFVDQPIPG
jgi:hypothetical protein